MKPTGWVDCGCLAETTFISIPIKLKESPSFTGTLTLGGTSSKASVSSGATTCARVRDCITPTLYGSQWSKCSWVMQIRSHFTMSCGVKAGGTIRSMRNGWGSSHGSNNTVLPAYSTMKLECPKYLTFISLQPASSKTAV